MKAPSENFYFSTFGRARKKEKVLVFNKQKFKMAKIVARQTVKTFKTSETTALEFILAISYRFLREKLGYKM